MAGRKPTVSDARFLRTLEAASDPVLATSEVQEEVGFSTSDGAKDRLLKLDESGLVASKKIGPNYAWWITEAGREYLREHTETAGDGQ